MIIRKSAFLTIGLDPSIGATGGAGPAHIYERRLWGAQQRSSGTRFAHAQ